MNAAKQHLSQSYKPCAAKDCSSPGIYEMEILFLGKTGWFCKQCKDNLMRDGLLIQHQLADNIVVKKNVSTNSMIGNTDNKSPAKADTAGG
jgi:hypothetical protein